MLEHLGTVDRDKEGRERSAKKSKKEREGGTDEDGDDPAKDWFSKDISEALNEHASVDDSCEGGETTSEPNHQWKRMGVN